MKIWISSVLAVSLLWIPGGANAESEPCKEPQNPVEVKKMLTDAAAKYDIPAEIVKAIAYHESGGIKQCAANSDGGIGVMQVTPSQFDYEEFDLDPERLQTDTAYNIEKGVQILDAKIKRSNISKVRNFSRSMIEHWYFAVRDYNGNVGRNDPAQNPGKTYQDLVFNYINTQVYASSKVAPYPTKHENTNPYDFEWNYGYTPSTSNLKQGDQVVTVKDAKFRSHPDTTTDLKPEKMPENTVVTILSNEKIEDPRSTNLFHYYKVRVNGKNGYMASSAIKPLRLEVSNPIAANADKKMADGKLVILKDTVMYKTLNGKKTSLPLKKGREVRIFNIEGMRYHVGGEYYVDHNPANVKVYVGEVIDRNKRSLLATADLHDRYMLGNGSSIQKTDVRSFSIGRVVSSKVKFSIYTPDNKVSRTVSPGYSFRVYRILPDRYITDGGYYILKNGLTYYPVTVFPK